ncbi:hypothetical protein ACIBG5_38635 [Kribbella sp. NPDC050241]|uniref:hypothetical protein n=1 Tax=Kribbella sp. NPDC050241 TaxID=3364115 RepID=UPI0037B92048
MAEGIALSSAIIAAIGLFFAGYQLLQFRKDRKREHDLEIQGVCASWRPISNPRDSDVRDGLAVWRYAIDVHNPGKFPINWVKVTMSFPVEFARLRGNTRTESGKELVVHQPVIAGGAHRTWERRLEMQWDEATDERLAAIAADVTFVDIQGRRQHTHWPRAKKTDD